MRWGAQALDDFLPILGRALADRGIRTGRYAIEKAPNLDYIRLTVIHDGEVFTDTVDAAEIYINRRALEDRILEFVDWIARKVSSFADPHDVAFLPEGVE